MVSADILSAGLDAGVAIGILVVYFCLQFPRNGSIGQSTIQSWWGNTVNINTADYGRNGGGSALTALAPGKTFGYVPQPFTLLVCTLF